MKKLAEIQRTLRTPKTQYNSFGKYYYRSCEDIFEAVKPLLDGARIHLSDELVMIGDRYYVRATATYLNGDYVYSVTAYAREEATKKGMDGAQITGTASSYARKYALNGLLLIDDQKDADTNEYPQNAQNGGQKAQTDKTDSTVPPVREKASTEEIETLKTMVETAGADMKKFLNYYKIATLEEIPKDRVVEASKLLEKKIQGANDE